VRAAAARHVRRLHVGPHERPRVRHHDPGLGRRDTSDAEDAEDAVTVAGSTFEIVDVVQWDAPMLTLPDAAAVVLYLRGRGGLTRERAEREAAAVEVPVDVTRRGVLVWARA